MSFHLPVPFIQLYGYDYLMYTFGEQFTIDELKENGMKWPADDTGDYVLYVLGLDAEGNVKRFEPAKAHYPL